MKNTAIPRKNSTLYDTTVYSTTRGTTVGLDSDAFSTTVLNGDEISAFDTTVISDPDSIRTANSDAFSTTIITDEDLDNLEVKEIDALCTVNEADFERALKQPTIHKPRPISEKFSSPEASYLKACFYY